MNKDKIGHPKYRIIIGLLIALSSASIFFSNVLVIPLLTNIAKDIGVELAIAGYISMITMLFMGITMLSGSIVVAKVGSKNTLIISLILTTAGNAISIYSVSFIMLLVGRALIGIGLGLSAVGSISCITSWFPAKEKPIIITINTVSASAVSFLASAVAVPLLEMVGGSWRNVFYIAGAATAVILILWILFGREHKESNEISNAENAMPAKKKGGIFVAIKRKEIWLLTGFVGLVVVGNTMIGTYLPAFLELVRGYDAQVAGTYGGFVALANMGGALFGGVIITIIKRRKLIFLPATIISVIALIFALNSGVSMVIISGLLCYGLFGGIQGPITQTVVTEIEGATPELVAGGYSIIFGAGSILSLFTPMVLSALMKSFTFFESMLLFIIVIAAGCLIGFFIKETGRNAKSNAKNIKIVEEKSK